MRRLITFLVLVALGFSVEAQVVVNREVVVGPIKPMNGVNNGPASPILKGNVQSRNNVEAYTAAKFPIVRTHDASFIANFGSEHVADITAIFPDFSKDATDPASYDFTITDWYLNNIREAGCEVFFRLGQRIENHIKKYNVFPPKDFKKWAVICEHIVRHYNEGWANGYKWNIRYWEIWNEPDLDVNCWQTSPRNWGGTAEQYYELYTVASKHLRKCFPDIKIGGPAWSGQVEWCEKFLTYINKKGAPMDFFSWHIYASTPTHIAEYANNVQAMLDRHGMSKTESILDEWNYVKNWTSDFQPSLRLMGTPKGAAFVASTMQACQDTSTDVLMYYDASPDSAFNGLFDHPTFRPTKTYYSLYAWRRLADYGTQVKASSTESDIYVTAARSTNGNMRVMITRYNDDNNVVSLKRVGVTTGENISGEVVAHLTDSSHTYTEIPLVVRNGEVEVAMEPNSVVVIDFE
ncbi:MAG: hypothetical protein IKV09_02605 [Alistipes sp.]|nr:hypothetical protein [Alistipes sp.]